MKSKYAIICSPRTGSTYLCSLLQDTKRAGNPDEFFNKTIDNRNCNIYSSNYKDCIIQTTKTKNEVFGAKVVDLNQFNNMKESGINFDSYIWLRREDKILQAISRYKAWWTGDWINRHKIGDVPYSQKDIKWCYDDLLKEEKFYSGFFNIINHIELWYNEDLCQAPQQTVIAVLDFIGVDTTNLPPMKAVHEIFRNEESYEWKDKFLKHG